MPAHKVHPHRIVITGGPGSGKTVVAQALAHERPERFMLVPEAATQVYTMLQTRWDKLDLEGRHDAQRKIYRLQIDQEDRIARAHPEKILLLDRGTIDGSAYWPEGPEHYWRDLGTTHDVELSRYDAVILLETAAALGLYDGDASNFCRFEDPAAALSSGRLLQQLWSGHPRQHFIPAQQTIEGKIASVRGMIDAVLP